jgi:hypothetical protein
MVGARRHGSCAGGGYEPPPSKLPTPSPQPRGLSRRSRVARVRAGRAAARRGAAGAGSEVCEVGVSEHRGGGGAGVARGSGAAIHHRKVVNQERTRRAPWRRPAKRPARSRPGAANSGSRAGRSWRSARRWRSPGSSGIRRRRRSAGVSPWARDSSRCSRGSCGSRGAARRVGGACVRSVRVAHEGRVA